MTNDSIQALQNLVKKFCEDRDWDQFHTPKDLAIGIITEASELLEMFRFLSAEEAADLLSNPQKKINIEDEIADVFFFILLFSQRFDIDLASALIKKIDKNEKKYPVEKSRGSNLRYTDL